jgi:hypothetical protein
VCGLDDFSKYCAFVLQDDVMHETLTPKGKYFIVDVSKYHYSLRVDQVFSQFKIGCFT